MGFAFAFCPPELHPGMKFWYDRTVGLRGDRTFDNARFGTIASILYYPGAAVPEKDPMTMPGWRALFLDPAGNGFFTWRNRYRDTGDLVAQVYVKRRGNRGHSGPDALSFRILGLDTLWAVGGGRYGPKWNGQDAYLRSMNTLYPADPDSRLEISRNRAASWVSRWSRPTAAGTWSAPSPATTSASRITPGASSPTIPAGPARRPCT
jgi:hypothetical protein